MESDDEAPDWRKDWKVDLAARRVRHRDGWVIEFLGAVDKAGGIDGRCVAQPEHLSVEQLTGVAQVMRQAGEIYSEQLRSADTPRQD